MRLSKTIEVKPNLQLTIEVNGEKKYGAVDVDTIHGYYLSVNDGVSIDITKLLDKLDVLDQSIESIDWDEVYNDTVTSKMEYAGEKQFELERGN